MVALELGGSWELGASVISLYCDGGVVALELRGSPELGASAIPSLCWWRGNWEGARDSAIKLVWDW